MSLPANPRRYTLEEYFKIERMSREKHEYRDGYIVNLNEVVAMAGSGVDHSRISANVAAALVTRLRGGSCAVFSSDLRVRIPRKVLWTYPDATVICGKPEVEPIPGVGDTATNPHTIIEVLSPSTESYDRGDKFARYREIPSLREYVLVSQHEPRVEVFHLKEDGAWVFLPVAGLEAQAPLLSLKIEVPLREIYSGVDFPSAAEEANNSVPRER
ncbi:MAG TPA: Uma2 family endonuclease [Tepidisphaeraceae bacterium]|jgi:Uma2 family endonuclease